jgi:hypothetical protein
VTTSRPPGSSLEYLGEPRLDLAVLRLDEIEVDRQRFDLGKRRLAGGRRQDEWMPLATTSRCASSEIMNCANSLAAFGLRAPLMIAVGDTTMNVPSLG